jgi:hypothetical protein
VEIRFRKRLSANHLEKLALRLIDFLIFRRHVRVSPSGVGLRHRLLVLLR